MSDELTSTFDTLEFQVPVVPGVPSVSGMPIGQVAGQAPAAAQDTYRRLREAYARLEREVRHAENHKQLVRFLCVGVAGYLVNLGAFAACIHVFGLADAASFVIAFLVGCANNFVLNRHWTFSSKEEHPARQGARYLVAQVLVALLAYGIFVLLTQAVGLDKKVMANGIAWVIATPFSFIIQKFWTFKA